MGPTTPQDWFKDFEALSRQYWTAWSDIAQPKPTDPAAAWQQGFEQWKRAVGGDSTQSELVDRLSAGAKTYVALMQSMLAAVSGQPGSNGTAAAWTEVLRNGFNLPGLDPALLNNPLAASLREISGQGAKGFERMMAEFAEAAAPFRQAAAATLAMPAFGYAREHQERWQKLATAWADQQKQSNRYQALMLKASQAGFERFQTKLAEREEPGRQLESLRQVYDLWIDAAEEAYAEVALSDEFREVYGALVNAQMRVRSLVQQEVEKTTAQLGMPTRSEVRSVEKSVYELRRALKDRNGGSSSGGLAAEVAALRTEVAALKKQLGSTAPKPVAKPSKR